MKLLDVLSSSKLFLEEALPCPFFQHAGSQLSPMSVPGVGNSLDLGEQTEVSSGAVLL